MTSQAVIDARGRVIDLFYNLLWYNRDRMEYYSHAVTVARDGQDPRYPEYQVACRFVADMERRGEEIVKEILGVTDGGELVEYERLLTNTLNQLGAAKPKRGILETFWGAAQGGFDELSTAGLTVDARSMVACMKKLVAEGKYDDVSVWIELIMSLMGLILDVGDIKIVKAVQERRDAAAIALFRKLRVDDDIMRWLAIISRLFEWLRQNVVKKIDAKIAPIADQAFKAIQKNIDDFKKKIGKAGARGVEEQVSVTVDGKKQTVFVKEILNMLDNPATSKRVIEIPEEAIAVIREGIEHQRILAQATEKKKSKLPRRFLKDEVANFGYAEVHIEGLTKNDFFAHSKINDTKRILDISPKPTGNNIKFKPFEVGGKGRIINGEGAFLRDPDTEYKILNDIANHLGDRNASGMIELFTERHPCASCILNIKQFESKYPNIIVIIYTN